MGLLPITGSPPGAIGGGASLRGGDQLRWLPVGLPPMGWLPVGLPPSLAWASLAGAWGLGLGWVGLASAWFCDSGWLWAGFRLDFGWIWLGLGWIWLDLAWIF